MSVSDIDDDDEKWLMHVRSQPAAQLGDALCKSARTGDLWRVETLLDMGVDIDYREGRVLLNAVSQHQHKVVDFLIERGLRLTQTVLDDALAEAAAQGDARLTKQFLAEGADAAHDNSVSLQNAIPRGNVDVFRALLTAGADARAGEGHGLCITIAHGHNAAALLMLEHGADPAVYYRGMTALDWAINLGQRDVADAIRSGDSGAVQQRDFFLSMNAADMVKPIDIYGGQTALHLAAKSGHFDVVCDKFLSSGTVLQTADLMQKTAAGQTVLLLLAQTGQLDKVFDPRLWVGRHAEAAALHAEHLPATHRGDIQIDRVLNAIDHAALHKKAEGFQLKPRPPKP